MTGTTLTITIDDAAVREMVGEIAKRARNLRPALASIGQHQVNSTWERFATGRTPDGARWAPLSDLTKPLKRIDKILIESSRLRDSVNWRVGGRDTLSVGSNVIYAAIHQFGGKIKRKPGGPPLIFPVGRQVVMGKRGQPLKKAGPLEYVFANEVTIPARPYLGVSKEDLAAIKGVLLDHLLRR